MMQFGGTERRSACRTAIELALVLPVVVLVAYVHWVQIAQWAGSARMDRAATGHLTDARQHTCWTGAGAADARCFTVVLATFKRHDSLMSAARHYRLCPRVAEVRVVWAESDTPVEMMESGVGGAPIVTDVHYPASSLNQRFNLLAAVKTQAVFSVDDDIRVACEDLDGAHGEWRRRPDRIVGYFPRGIAQDGDTGEYSYQGFTKVALAREYAMVLSKAAFVSTELLAFYSGGGARQVAAREMVAKGRNCEDLALQFAAAEFARGAPPLFYSPRHEIVDYGSWMAGYYMAGISSSSGVGQSHMAARSACVTALARIYAGHTYPADPARGPLTTTDAVRGARVWLPANGFERISADLWTGVLSGALEIAGLVVVALAAVVVAVAARVRGASRVGTPPARASRGALSCAAEEAGAREDMMDGNGSFSKREPHVREMAAVGFTKTGLPLPVGTAFRRLSFQHRIRMSEVRDACVRHKKCTAAACLALCLAAAAVPSYMALHNNNLTAAAPPAPLYVSPCNATVPKFTPPAFDSPIAGKALRVAVFSGVYAGHVDGVSMTLNRMVADLLKKGHQVLVFAPDKPKPGPKRHVGDVVMVKSVPLSFIGRADYSYGYSLGERGLAELEAFQPDVIHAATPDGAASEALEYAKARNLPTVCSYHTRFNTYFAYYGAGFLEPVYWWSTAKFYNKCDRVLPPTAGVGLELAANGIAQPIDVWPRGVELEKYTPAKRCEAWRAELGFQPKDVVVAFASRLVLEKNLKLVVDTIKALEAAGVPHRSLVIGTGAAAGWMRAQLPRTVFLGHADSSKLGVAYASADVFLFPSLSETFGNVILEAMASGTPVVGCNASGTSALVVEGETGRLVDPNAGGAAMAAAVKELIVKPALREGMRAKARARAEKFTWDAAFHMLHTSYNTAGLARWGADRFEARGN